MVNGPLNSISSAMNLCWAHPVCESNRLQFSICRPGPWSWMSAGIVSVVCRSSETIRKRWSATFSDSVWPHRWPVERPALQSNVLWSAILGNISEYCPCPLNRFHSTRKSHCRDTAETFAVKSGNNNWQIQWKSLSIFGGNGETHMTFLVHTLVVQFRELLRRSTAFVQLRSKFLRSNDNKLISTPFSLEMQCKLPLSWYVWYRIGAINEIESCSTPNVRG